MPKNLKRITGYGDLHSVTSCCYHRRALLGRYYDPWYAHRPQH
jgi:hypothetical protein